MKYNLSFLILLTVLFANKAHSQSDYILKTCGNNYLYSYYRPVHLNDGSLYSFSIYKDSIEQNGVVTDSAATNYHGRITHYTNNYKTDWVFDYTNNYGFSTFSCNTQNGRLYIQAFEENKNSISFDGVHVIAGNPGNMLGVYVLDERGKVVQYKKLVSSTSHLSTGNILYTQNAIYAIAQVKGDYNLNGKKYAADSNWYNMLLIKLDSNLDYISHNVVMKSNYGFDYVPAILKAEKENIYMITNVTDSLILDNGNAVNSYDMFVPTRDILLTHINTTQMQTDWVKRIGGAGGEEMFSPPQQTVSNDSLVSLVFNYGTTPFHFDNAKDSVLNPDSFGYALLTFNKLGSLIAKDFIIPFNSDSDQLYANIYIDTNNLLFLGVNNDNNFLLNSNVYTMKYAHKNYSNVLFFKNYNNLSSSFSLVTNLENSQYLGLYNYHKNYIYLNTGLYTQTQASIGNYNYGSCKDMDRATFCMKLFLWDATVIYTPLSKNIFTVYPNPTIGVFTIECGSSAKSLVEVYSVLGEKMYTEPWNSDSRKTFDFSSLPKGIYFIRLCEVIQRIVLY